MTIGISVILPTHNCEFIERSVNSVLNQNYKSWELIVIDNFSKNNVRKILSKKKDRRIKYFKFRNKGIIGKSRNFGIKKAKFKWIAFLDSDDYWTKNKLKLVEKQINKTNCDFFYHNMFIKKDSHSIIKKKLYKHNICIKKPIFDNLVINGNSIAQSSVVVKKNLIKKAGFISENKKLVTWEDFDLWLNISKLSNNFCLINETLGYYYIKNESKKLKRYIKNIKHFKKIYKNEIKNIKVKYNIKNIWWINYAEALQFFKKKQYTKSYLKIKKITTNSIRMNFNINLFKIIYHINNFINAKKN